jgi:hypothetical protein
VFRKILIPRLVLGFILITSIYRIYLDFKTLNLDFLFGYVDYQHYWSSWSSLVSGGVLYKDFFWEYGFLYLAVGLPFFVILGKSFFASIFTMLIIMPIIGLILCLIIGKLNLSKFWLVLFMILMLIYGIDTYYVSMRHFLPELGIVLFILGYEKYQKKKVLLGSFLLGLSMFSGIEYGLVSLIVIIFYLLLKFLSRRLLPFKFSFLGLLIILFFLFLNLFILHKQQVLINYTQFLTEYISTFNYFSPCREFFPRLNSFTNRKYFIDNLVALNLYIIPISILILSVWLLIKSKLKENIPFILSLLFYSSGVFFRAVSTPCFAYVSYGLTLYFLALILIIKFYPKTKTSWFCWVLLLWFFTVGLSKFLLTLHQLPPGKNSIKKILPIAEVKLSANLTDEYHDIVNYLKENTSGNDYLYVYPNGPYNQLTGRKSPVSITSTWYYGLVPSLNKVTLSQLQKKKPKYLVINIHNAYNIYSSLSNFPYNLYINDKHLVFDGVVTPVEEYLSQNYELVKTNKIAWILKRTDNAIELHKKYLPEQSTWQIQYEGYDFINYDPDNTTYNFRPNPNKNENFLVLSSDKINNLNLIKLPIKVNLGILRPVSKFVIKVLYAYGNQVFPLTMQSVSSDWQNIWIFPYRINDSQVPVKILVSVSNNLGFFPFGKPFGISIKIPQGFLVNPVIDYSTAAFKIQ